MSPQYLQYALTMYTGTWNSIRHSYTQRKHEYFVLYIYWIEKPGVTNYRNKTLLPTVESKFVYR